IVLVVVVCHVAFFYSLARTRAARASSTGGAPMFGPVISDVWRPPRGSPLAARPPAPSVEDSSIPPARHWTLPAIDIFPSAHSPTPSEFTPVTEATADPPDVQIVSQGKPSDKKPVASRQKLVMVLWVRPQYPNECAWAGMEGSVLLDLKIDASGQPVETAVAQSSGWKELDQAALHAATLWRFAPPRWESRPVAVTCRVEVRFHREDAVPSSGLL